MATRYDDARREAVRLRNEERLSLDEITARLGVRRGTCYSWIRDIPLTGRARRAAPPQRKCRGKRSALHALAEGQDYSPLEAGAIAESAAVLRLAIKRWKVLNAAFDGDVVDLYATRPGASSLVKIQVRTAREGVGCGQPIVSLRRMHNGRAVRYARGDFDILVGYRLYTDTAYVWTYDEVADLKCSVTVSDAAAEAWHKLDLAFREAA